MGLLHNVYSMLVDEPWSMEFRMFFYCICKWPILIILAGSQTKVLNYTLCNDTKHTENEMYNDSSFSLNTSECKYVISVEFSKYFKPETVSLSMFCVNSCNLEAHWDTLQKLLLTMSSYGLTLYFIGLIEVFKIQYVLHYTINGYHNSLFNARLYAADGHGE